MKNIIKFAVVLNLACAKATANAASEILCKENVAGKRPGSREIFSTL